MTALIEVSPITDDDQAIAEALKEASIPTLMLSMIHMSGNSNLLDGDLRPHACIYNDMQGQMSEDEQATVRAKALEVIKAYRDGGCASGAPPSSETVHRMMSFLVAEDVPAEYTEMMLEELELDGVDHRAVNLGHVDKATRESLNVLVIGGGMSGILAAIRLEQAGIPYTVIEKNPAVGGTWFENRYPGCRVDVANHFYCYSFEPNHEWSEFFSQQPELQSYFEHCVEKYGIRDKFRFNTEVVAARFDDSSQQWHVSLRSEDSGDTEVTSTALISCVGQLNRPKLPDIDGIERFAGYQCHSANWNPDYDIRGRRVAVVGSGASAFQLVPAIAGQCEQLTVFQRSAPWMFENPHYHSEVGTGKKWCLEHLPYYARWYRFMLFWSSCDGLLPKLKIDPDWPHQERSINAYNDQVRSRNLDYLKRQVGDNEELLAKVTPNYVSGGKRMLQDNGSWLNALKRDNVELCTDGIASINTDGILTRDGRQIDVDVIVYATGFHANRFLWPMEIIGRNNTALSTQWGEAPEAYLGITAPNFPNLFCLYGPNTNLASGGNLIFHSECQIRYVMGCLKAMLEQQIASLEVKPSVTTAFNEKLQREISQMVWAHPSIENSWYRNSKGKVTTLSPWRLLDYWRWTKQPDLDDYIHVKKTEHLNQSAQA